MSGTPTKTEVDNQWKAAIDILEDIRVLADATLAGGGGKFDTLLTQLEGEYTPADLATFVNNVRGGVSDLITPGVAASAITPILYEYAQLMAAEVSGGYGSGLRSLDQIFRSVFDYFHEKSYTVNSRAITYDTTATTGHIGGPTPGTIEGNGEMARLTVDEYGYNLEACHVERKAFRCRSDQNTGTNENAEVFEMLGELSSYDSLLRGSFGSGESGRTTITAKNGGTGSGGSLLANSSFNSYSATGSPKFSGWTEDTGGANIAQDTTTTYRTTPGATTEGSLKMNSGGGQIILKQVLGSMRINRLDSNTPYFFRAMVNKSAGTGVGGNIIVRVGNQTVTTTVASLAAGWNEIILPLDANCWPRNFNEDPFDIEIEWDSPSTGYLLVDDVIFAPFDLIDGTYWILRGNQNAHTPFMLDDTLEFTDTGGAPGTGILQWWMFVSGFGYLPSSGTPSITDP